MKDLSEDENVTTGEGARGGADEAAAGNYKWVPVITSYCIGCGKCVDACPHASIKPVWDFATLVRPDTCVGAGDCIPVCEDDATIHMQWVEISEESSAMDREIGKWCAEPPQPSPRKRMGLFERIIWLFKEDERPS
ncbi:MAG: ATP-binding protein [Verrucomicrobiales bacterium]